MTFDGKTVVVTGGTGSLGTYFIQRILSGGNGKPSKVIVFSRDESKQHTLRIKLSKMKAATDDVIYQDIQSRVRFVIGDIRNAKSVESVLAGANIVIHAAAMKQVPTCEYNPLEAVQTNVIGTANVVQAVRSAGKNGPDVVVGISTDKAVLPINLYGMTKGIQERMFTEANLHSDTRFVSVRYGNVLNSTGSILPLFRDQILRGSSVTVTTTEMTRFLFSMNEAVDTIVVALKDDARGAIYVPKMASARIYDLAKVLIGNRSNTIQIIGVRPGEKTHEVLITSEEQCRASRLGNYTRISSSLPELTVGSPIGHDPQYTSEDFLMCAAEIGTLLNVHNLNTKG